MADNRPASRELEARASVSTDASSTAPKKEHPFARLGKALAGLVGRKKEKTQEQIDAEAQQANQEQNDRLLRKAAGMKPEKKKKKRGFFASIKNKILRRADDDDSSSDGSDVGARPDDDEWEGNVSGTYDSDEGSEDWDGLQEDEPEEDEELDAFRVGEQHPNFVESEPIERLSPQEIMELERTMHRMNPKYKKAEDEILEGKLEQAVNDRLARLRKANKVNALIAFGAPRIVMNEDRVARLREAANPAAFIAFEASREKTISLGNLKVPTLITVSGHHGVGGNLGVNGVYERYPDNCSGRPVYQKYLERDEWVLEPQTIEFKNGYQTHAMQDLSDPWGGRTFPTQYDDQDTRRNLKYPSALEIMQDEARQEGRGVKEPPGANGVPSDARAMVSVKVLPAREVYHTPHFRHVDKEERWFIYFDDLQGAWCIGPKPGSSACFARCYGVDDALPDNLGPNRWEVFDVGHRIWHTHKYLKTVKGGAVSSAICG